MTGIILAGGCNSRIDQPKAFIHVSEISIIENTIHLFEDEFDEIIIVSNDPHCYQQFGYPVICDIYKNMGPLGGIHAGLNFSTSQYNFINACDMPFLNNKIIRCLKSSCAGFDAVVPVHEGFYEPLCAIYSKNCLNIIETCLSEGIRCIRSFYPSVNLNTITWEKGNRINNNPSVFFNINTPLNLKQAKDYLTSKNGSYD